MNILEKYTEKTVIWLTTIAIFVFISMMILIVANVITRAFNWPILFTQEAVSIMMLITVSVALGYCALMHNHIVINIFLNHLGPKIRFVFAIITSVLSIIIWTLIGWQSFMFGIEQLHIDERTTIMEWPLYPYRFVFAFGIFVLCLLLIVDLKKLLRND